MSDSISAYCAVWLINRQPLYIIWQIAFTSGWKEKTASGSHYNGWIDTEGDWCFKKITWAGCPVHLASFLFLPTCKWLWETENVFFDKIAFMYSMGLFSERPSLCIILILCVIYWKMNWAVFKSFFSSSLFFSAVLQHSDGATHQWTVTWASTDISTRCVLVCCWSKLQFNTATVNVPEAHIEPRSQFKAPYSAMPCSRVCVWAFSLSKIPLHLSSVASVRGINISLV